MTERSCPQCKSADLDEQALGTKGSAWPVTFGITLFHKKPLVAFACKACGYVFLYLG